MIFNFTFCTDAMHRVSAENLIQSLDSDGMHRPGTDGMHRVSTEI